MPNNRSILAAALPALSFCVLAAARLPAAAADDYSQWTSSSELFLDTSPDGAGVSGAVTGFPLLVRLDKDVFDFSKARGDGRDIRFSSASGKHLPYQIDRWDSAAGRAALWVRVDTVKGNDAFQSLRMHWGRPSAGDSASPAAVFDTADGFSAVWHMGAGPDGVWGNRGNSAAGGKTAVPNGYDGDESVPGLIGLCDSLSNEADDEDYLTLGDGYEDLAQGFTFSAWAYPTQAANWARIIDLGNGPGLDNIAVGRHDSSDALFLDVYNSNLKSASVNVDAAYAANQWQLIEISVAGTLARVYRNGALVRLDTLTQAIPSVRRAYNYLGKSNGYGDAYYRGRLDEVRLSHVARGADWARLSHANQKADQSLVSFARKPAACTVRFSVPADTTLEEGMILQLQAIAECATAMTWTPVSGPMPRIPDPDVKVLQLPLPRIAGDTDMVLRFTATFPDSIREDEVRVRLKEAVPDPVFTLPPDRTWDGMDSLLLLPEIQNLAAVKASRDSVIRYTWTLKGPEADTAWRGGALLIGEPKETGTLEVELCLDNGGKRLCRKLEIEVTGSPTARRRREGIGGFRAAAPRWDAAGRKLPGSGVDRDLPRIGLRPR